MQQVAFVLTTDLALRQGEEMASGAEQHKGLPCALGRGKGHESGQRRGSFSPGGSESGRSVWASCF